MTEEDREENPELGFKGLGFKKSFREREEEGEGMSCGRAIGISGTSDEGGRV